MNADEFIEADSGDVIAYTQDGEVCVVAYDLPTHQAEDIVLKIKQALRTWDGWE